MRGRVNEVKRCFLLRRQPGKQHVKDVEVRLVAGLCDHPELLQQVVLVSGPQDVPASREDEVKVLAKPGTVVVHHCLSVPEGLQDWIHLEEEGAA